MPNTVKAAFRPDVVSLKLDTLVPSRVLDPRERHNAKYKQIATSLSVVGLIEPLVVFASGQGKYKVLDGNKRLDILIQRASIEVECLLATDDEVYTYNKRVNYLSPVGEHRMILRALEHNSEDRIAEALNVDISVIRRKCALLNGVCNEAVEVLKDRRATAKAFAALRKMKPVRQLEAAKLMVASNTYSGRFVSALVTGTRDELLVDPAKHRPSKSLLADQKTRIENETESLLQNLKAVEASYGTEVLTLSVSRRYLGRVLANLKVHQYLEAMHSDILRELESIVEAMDLELAPPPSDLPKS